MKKPFMFSTLGGRGFRLVVFARNERSARAYVRSQRTKAHQALRFVGAGQPPLAEQGSWVAAQVS